MVGEVGSSDALLFSSDHTLLIFELHEIEQVLFEGQIVLGSLLCLCLEGFSEGRYPELSGIIVDLFAYRLV